MEVENSVHLYVCNFYILLVSGGISVLSFYSFVNILFNSVHFPEYKPEISSHVERFAGLIKLDSPRFYKSVKNS